MEPSSFSDNCTAGRPSSLRSPTRSTKTRLSDEITRTHALLICETKHLVDDALSKVGWQNCENVFVSGKIF